MNNFFRHRRHDQSGFSMVELMVAITIGLFMLIGLIQVLTGSRQNYRVQTGVGDTQENGRFALELLSRQIRGAGYRATPLLTAPYAAVAGVNNVTGSSTILSGTDVIFVTYEGPMDGSGSNCLGNELTAGTRATMMFFVNNERELRCAVFTPPPVINASTLNTAGQPLLKGINDMQVLYGEQNIDRSTNPPTYSFRYLTQDSVSNWDNIVSVRIDLTTESLESVDASLPNNGKLERTYATTITIRNRI